MKEEDGRVPMIYLMSVGCGMQFTGKKWIMPGVKRMAGVERSMAVAGGSGEGAAAAAGG